MLYVYSLGKLIRFSLKMRLSPTDLHSFPEGQQFGHLGLRSGLWCALGLSEVVTASVFLQCGLWLSEITNSFFDLQGSL